MGTRNRPCSNINRSKIVEKLKKEGIDKHDLGREKFLKEAWKWTRIYGGTIVKQQKD